MSSNTDKKYQLVSKVKAYQRQSQNHSRQWSAYVRSTGSRINDLNSQDVPVLAGFLRTAATGGWVDSAEVGYDDAGKTGKSFNEAPGHACSLSSSPNDS